MTNSQPALSPSAGPAAISRAEWRWVLGWGGAVLLLTCLPYLAAAVTAPPGWHFAGFLVNPLDGHSYLAKMRQGFEGNWLFHLAFTPEPHAGAFIFTFYLALGHLARLAHLPLILVFHLARLAAGLALLLAAYRFIAAVTPRRPERRLAYGLLLTASGLGWLGAALGAFPIDLWVPEAFVPYSLYANPHFPLAMALMLVILYNVTPIQNSSFIMQNFLAGLALALVLPFALLTTGAVIAGFLGWLAYDRRAIPWRQLWPAAAAGLGGAPVIAYDYWVQTANPALAGWGAQNLTPAPTLLNLLLGYGLVGLLALAGAWFSLRERRGGLPPGEALVLAWAAITLVLVYVPFELQRRLINGLHLPLVILAAIGLSRWPGRLKRRRLAVGVVLAVGALGTLFVWGVPLLGTRQPAVSGTAGLFFLRQDEQAALDWLRANGRPGQVVLASPRLGMFVPGQTGLRAYYGHPFETLDAAAKKAAVEAFYRGEPASLVPPADYIIYGPSEQALGRPAGLADFTVVYQANDVLIVTR